MSKNNSGISEDTKTIITVLVLIFFYPIGVFMMLLWTKWPRMIKIILSLPLVLSIIAAILILLGIFALTR